MPHQHLLSLMDKYTVSFLRTQASPYILNHNSIAFKLEGQMCH